MTEYAPGTPIWVDVASPDVDKTREFYSGLFGWKAEVVPDGGGYTMFYHDGKMVGAGGPTMSPDQHPAWNTYVRSDNADETAQKVKDAGGQVVMEPMDVMGQGRMAVFADPTGAYFSIWQPQIHRGIELANEPGSFCWSELYTRDVPAATEFYKKAFNWGIEKSEFSGGEYTLFQVDGRNVAGGLDMSAMLPDSIPPHWLVYFTVENAADAVAKAKELGATILMGPETTPMGPIAVIQDPVGAAFAIIQAQTQS